MKDDEDYRTSDPRTTTSPALTSPQPEREDAPTSAPEVGVLDVCAAADAALEVELDTREDENDDDEEATDEDEDDEAAEDEALEEEAMDDEEDATEVEEAREDDALDEAEGPDPLAERTDAETTADEPTRKKGAGQHSFVRVRGILGLTAIADGRLGGKHGVGRDASTNGRERRALARSAGRVSSGGGSVALVEGRRSVDAHCKKRPEQGKESVLRQRERGMDKIFYAPGSTASPSHWSKEPAS